MWENKCCCLGQPYEVSAAELLTSVENVESAVQVLLVAQAITSWTGCEECRVAFATLLERARGVLHQLEDDALKKWTELD